MPVILPTDAIFFLLIIGIVVYFLRISRDPYLANTWGKLLRNRTAMTASIVLLFYFAIAILDSLHYKPLIDHNERGEAVYSAQVLSVLDMLLEPLRTRTETSYSEPLTSYAYVKEMIKDDNGNLVRDYPRLKYGGAHLEDPATQQLTDILARIVGGAIAGSVIAAALLWLLCMVVAWRRQLVARDVVQRLVCAQHEIPFRAMALTFLSIVAVIGILTALSAQYHVAGTDKIGQDVLYQAIKSIRTGVLIGTLTTLIMLPFALALGITAGYFLGWIDDVIQYLYTTLNSIPGVLLIAAAVLMLHVYMGQNPEQFSDITTRADTRLLFLCMILGITSWTGLCRLLRAETLKVKEIDYVESARVLGASHLRVIFRHITPNVMHIVFIVIALDFSGLVLAEVVLSYVDIGVDPAMPSWGNMINSARLELSREPVVWWPLLTAMLFLFVLVLCANLFADGVRDAFDPRTETGSSASQVQRV